MTVRDPNLFQHPDRLQLARRLDHPGQCQQLEHLVAPTRLVQTQHLVGGAQHLPQMPGLTRQYRRFLVAELIVVEVQSVLVGVQPLPSDRFQHLYLCRSARRPDVLDLPRPTPIRVHDLHPRLPRSQYSPSGHRPPQQAKEPGLVHDPPTKSPSQSQLQLQNGQN
jgi:hypothetical protein